MTNPFSGTDDPHVCARCAEQGTTCCFVEPGGEEFCFPLSESERDTIVAYCSEYPELKAIRGVEDEPNSAAFLDVLCRLFPHDKKRLQELFPEAGSHLRLASTKAGRCAYLGDSGCILPREVRPWYCLLFPFWVRGLSLTMFTAMGCLVCRETDTVPQSLALIGMNAEDVRNIFDKLRQAWGLDD